MVRVKIGLSWPEDEMRKWEIIVSRALSPFARTDATIKANVGQVSVAMLEA